jgi:hypothetical protein
MFLTNSVFRSRLSDFSPEADESYWTTVQVVLNQPWFIAKIIYTDDSDAEGETRSSREMLFANIRDIEAIKLHEEEARITVDSVFVVTPAQVNGTGQLKMERLSAHWVAHEPLHPAMTANIYETYDGNRYGLSSLGTPVRDLLDQALQLTF